MSKDKVLKRHEYTTEQFARRASVSVRTLRWYDRQGLLKPTSRSLANHRRYTDDDLAVLQQILALKFLGFSLAQIRLFLQHKPFNLQGVLARQKAMLHEQRAHIQAVIDAIGAAEQAAMEGCTDWQTITHIIEVMQMDQNEQWIDKYFTPEQRRQGNELVERSYPPAAREKLPARGAWTEADQQRVDAEYAALAADLKRVVAAGADPDSPEAQNVAARQLDLLHQFTQGDPDVEAGLNAAWQNNDALPASEQPFTMPWSAEEGAFLQRAMAIYTERQGS